MVYCFAPMGHGTPTVDFAIRLADEGVPLRAIARATRISSEDLRGILIDARNEGRLIEMPRDDWPPGFPRDQRALQLSRMITEDPRSVQTTIQRMFSLSRSETTMFLALLQNSQVSRNRTGIAPKSVDVYICRIRKALEPHRIEIATLWGYGYQMNPPDRRKIMDLILTAVRNFASMSDLPEPVLA